MKTDKKYDKSNPDIESTSLPVHGYNKFAINKLSFYLSGYPMTNSGPLSRGQTHSPNFKCCILSVSDLKSCHKSDNKVGSLNLVEHLVGFEIATFQFIFNAFTHNASLSNTFSQSGKNYQ